jgi:phospholipid/cholesterol/gamma-HCH transport system substrate-binding protein
MEKNANYALVGLSAIVLFVGLVIFSVWLARISFSRDYDVYRILFQGPVSGLSQGGEVRFNGIKVGEITRINLYKPDPTKVETIIRVESEAPIRLDSFATVEPQGITAVSYIQISAGTPSKQLLKAVTPKGEIPLIRSQRSALSDLLAGGGTVLTRTIEALDRVNRVLSDQNVKTFSSALADTQAVTAELRQRKQVIADAQAALQSIDKAADEISALAESGQALVDGDGKRTMKNLADAAEEARATAKDVRAMIAKLEGPTTDFATHGLPQVSQAVVSLQSAAESLERLANEIEANPRGLVGKTPAEEMKVKP